MGIFMVAVAFLCISTVDRVLSAMLQRFSGGQSMYSGGA